MSIPYLQTWCGVTAILECSLKPAASGSLEMQDPKNRRLGTIAQMHILNQVKVNYGRPM